MSARTPGRLTVRGGYSIYADDGKTPVADTCLTNSVPTNDEANARRLVACWNACEGLSTEFLARIDSIQAALTGQLVVTQALEAERDELLDALELCRKELYEWMRDHGQDIATQHAMIKARAAIAKATGGAA